MVNNTPRKPLCFVLMPFGEKPDSMGNVIDFDAVYGQLIKPAIEAADLEPIRADEEQAGAIIHKPMFERLVLCEYAVADLTTANANVFYELGVRHAVKPSTTVLMFSHDSRMPFDVGLLRALPYHLGGDGRPSRTDADSSALTERLGRIREEAAAREKPMVDSPIYQLLDGYPDIDHARTDVFRDKVVYAERLKTELAALREKAKTTGDLPVALEGVRTLEQHLGRLDAVEAGVVVDLFLSYRALSSWEDMIRLVDIMPKPLAATVLIQEQLAFALNRAGSAWEAERILLELIEKRGPSGESCGLLGRVYKDLWERAAEAGDTPVANTYLRKAIAAYRNGFEADWRDAYAGINLVTLLEVQGPDSDREHKPAPELLLPMVQYAAERKVTTGKPDYWDHATLLEAAVLNRDQRAAETALGEALVAVRETWEPESTARNLRLIRQVREARQELVEWADAIEEALVKRAQSR